MSGHFGAPESPDQSSEPYVYTSIRYDSRLVNSEKNTAASCNKPCPFYMLEHHWTRLQVAKWSTFFFADDRPQPNSGGPSVLYHALLKAVKQWHDKHPGVNPEALRIKLRSCVGGRMATEIYHPMKSIPMSSLFPTAFDVTPGQEAVEWTVVLDIEPTEPGEETMFKTSDRSAYARARAAAGITTLMAPKEVLLYTPGHCILDGSIATPYFFRAGRWATPASSEGGLQGTTRRWALENKLCVEDNINIESLVEGEVVWFSNAVRGYFPALFHKREPPKGGPDEDTVQRTHPERFTH